VSQSEHDPVRVFYSYCREDESLRDELGKHLATMRKIRLVDDWHDRNLIPGEEWESIIAERLESSQLILLLISSDFFSSDSCDKEMKRALTKRAEGKAEVISIILRPVDWDLEPLRKLQALPKDAIPVTDWANRDSAWVDVVKGVRRAVEKIRHDLETTKGRTAVISDSVESDRVSGVRAELAVQAWLAQRYQASNVDRGMRPAPVDFVVRDRDGKRIAVEVKVARPFSMPIVHQVISQIRQYRAGSGQDICGCLFLVASNLDEGVAALEKVVRWDIPEELDCTVGYLDKGGDLQIVGNK
jgi:hypothetical protein